MSRRSASSRPARTARPSSSRSRQRNSSARWAASASSRRMRSTARRGPDMPDWLTNMEPHWAWLSLGVLLAAAEIVAPGFLLIWIGAAAIVTGIVAWVAPIGVPVQLGLFALLAVVILYGARKWLRDNPITSTDPHLNQRASRLVGEVLTVTTAIEDGRGREIGREQV